MEILPDHVATNQGPPAEVTFQLAPPAPDQPFQRVAGIAVGEDTWQDERVAQEPALEPLTVTLPEGMSRAMVAFAHKHIGPNATNPEIEYVCHTFAEAVGHTAAGSTVKEPEYVRYYGGTAQATSIYKNGVRIEPEELRVGEHGVVGDPDENKPATRSAVEHSMVGIGGGRAIQVDTHRGGLYIGRPEDYLKSVETRNARNNMTTTQPGLYVHREPVAVPDKQPSRVQRLGSALRNRVSPRRNK